jgi:hypothetical protein
LKSGCLNLPEPSGLVQACNGTAITLPSNGTDIAVFSKQSFEENHGSAEKIKSYTKNYLINK